LAPRLAPQPRRRSSNNPLTCAPSRIRTCDLLLRSNPAVDAVAISDDAGQVRARGHCCSPSYLVIASRDTGRTIATEDAVWIASKACLSTTLSSLANQGLPAAPVGSDSAASPGRSRRR
jgi:hypothetical protein